MKKIVSILMAALACAGVFAAGKKPKVKQAKKELVDWQGAKFGKEMPAWMESQSAAQKAFGAGGKKIFFVEVTGENLEFLQKKGDMEAQSQCVQTLSLDFEREAAGVYSGNDMSSDEEFMETQKAISKVRLSNLEKADSYWALYRSPKVKRPKKDDDYEYSYSYWVVFSMEKKVFDAFKKQALDAIKSDSPKMKELKERLDRQWSE